MLARQDRQVLLEVVVRAVEAQVELVGFEEIKLLTHGRGHDAVRLSLWAPQLDNRVVVTGWLMWGRPAVERSWGR